MLICAYIISISGMILCTIPFLGLIISTTGLVLFLIIQKNKKYTTNRILLTLGIIVSTIAVILCTVHTLVIPLIEYLKSSEIVNGAKLDVIKIQRQEVEQRINLYLMLNKAADKEKTLKNKILSSKVDNSKIVYNSSEINKIQDKSLKEKIAISNSSNTYYKINTKNLEGLSSSIDINDFVVDKNGNVYINTKLY